MAAFKRLSVPVLAILLVITLSAGGVVLVQSIDDGSPGVEIRLPPPTTSPEPSVLKVHVSGQVDAPGVFDMAPGDRVEDAILAAGGALEEAQLSCINLAQRVTDEAQYHVPSSEEGCALPSANTGASNTGLLDLNAASAQELEGLPGIGEVKAGEIVAYRGEFGAFQTVEQILEVNGIGPATYEAIKDLVYVGNEAR